MKFCLNIQNGDYQIAFRLQQDLRRAPCPNRSVIGPHDLVAGTIEEIHALQKPNVVFTVGEEEYICNPSVDISTVGFVDELGYAIYAFDDHYPPPPSRDELEKVLRRRIRENHFLFLDRAAQYRLVPLDDWQRNRQEHEGYVCRLGYFESQPRWLFGRKVEHPDTDFLFKAALNAWHNYILHKELNDDIELYGDTFGRPLLEPDAVYAELRQLT